MAMLPIVERELRVAARNPVLFRSRLRLPLVGGAILLLFLWSTRFGAPIQMVAKPMFNFCFYGLFASCLFAGIHTTADAISSEKREGTLGFLFLTDLKGYDVILGKLVASSIAGIYTALGMLPLVSIIFLFGGVDWGQVLRLVITCGNALYFSLSGGLLASVLSNEEKKAKMLATAIVVGFSALGPVIGVLVFWFQHGWNQSVSMSFWYPYLLCSPVGAFTSSISSTLGIGWKAWLISNGIVHLIGWLFLLLSCHLVTRTWQEKGAQDEPMPLLWRWKRWMAGAPEQNLQRRATMLDRNAVYWLTFREARKAWLVWSSLGMALAAFAGLYFYLGSGALLNPATAVLFVLATNTIMKLSMIGEAGRWIAQDRQNGVLELILTTPMRVEEILEGQRLSLRQLYRLPFIVCGLMQIFFVVSCLAQTPGRNPFETFLLGGVVLGFSLWMMRIDFGAIGWVGMWHALSTTPINKTKSRTSGTILFIPWATFYVVMIFVAWLVRGNAVFFAVVIWPVLMVGIPLWFAKGAKARLLAEFRLRAMERYSALPAHPWWAKAGRFVAQIRHRRRGARSIDHSQDNG